MKTLMLSHMQYFHWNNGSWSSSGTKISLHHSLTPNRHFHEVIVGALFLLLEQNRIKSPQKTIHILPQKVPDHNLFSIQIHHQIAFLGFSSSI